MNKKTIIISICLVIFVITIILFVFSNNNNKNDDIEIKNDVEKSSNIQSELSDDVINDLKNNLGKGKNGDVVSIDQRKTEKGEDQYIFTYNDGTTQTITIKDKEEGSGIEDIDPTPTEEDKPQEENPQEEEQSQEPSQEEPQEDLGTVFERYMNMSKREKFFFYRSFETQSEFVKWYEAAQEEYSKLHPTVEIGKDQYIVFGD